MLALATIQRASIKAPIAKRGRMTGKPHIVVVDDEQDIRETIQDYLEMNGFEVTTAEEGKALRRVIESEDVDLVLLDINMPGEDGLSLARYLRERGGVAIVMLTAAGEVVDKIVGLEIGADDYVAKPFDLRELMARIKAVLRRVSAAPAASVEAQASQIAFGDFRLDLDAHKLYDTAGEEVSITSMEFDLLKVFAEHPNRVLNRDQLLDMAHNRGWEPFDRSIDIRITRLRKKIEADPSKPQIIKTVRGAGYIYVPKGRQAER